MVNPAGLEASTRRASKLPLLALYPVSCKDDFFKQPHPVQLQKLLILIPWSTNKDARITISTDPI